MSAEWFKFYPAAWLEHREVKKMHRVARSYYFDLLCHLWIGGSLPDNLREVANILNELPRSFAVHWPSVRGRFEVDSHARLTHPKLESLRNEMRAKVEQSSNAAKRRWSGDADALRLRKSRQYDLRVDKEEERDIEKEGRSSAQARVGPILPDIGKPESSKERQQVDRWRQPALAVLERLNAARKRVMPRARPIRPTYASLSGIAARLDAGKTCEECLTVVDNFEAEVRQRPASAQWFDAVSPWRAANFERHLSSSPEAVLNGARQTGEMPHPPRWKGHDLGD